VSHSPLFGVMWILKGPKWLCTVVYCLEVAATNSIEKKVLHVNEPALYSLIFRSRNDEAKLFKSESANP
jgi:hypothetical protein